MIDLTDKSMMFQDAYGALPVVNNGDPIGLVIDQHKMGGLTLAAYRAAQPEKVTNGSFRTDLSGWSNNGNGTFAFEPGGGARVTATTGAAPYLYQGFATEVGRWYEVAVRLKAANSDQYVTVGVAAMGSTLLGFQALTVGVIRRYFFKATAVTSFVNLGGNGGGPDYGVFDSVSVKEIDGHHATTTNRPVWNSTEGAVRFTAAGEQRLLQDYFNAANNNFIAGWAKPLSTTNMAIFGVSDSAPAPTRYATLRTNGGGADALFGTGAFMSAAGTAPANSNVSLVSTENGTMAKLFANGGSMQAAPITGQTLPNFADNLSAYIGANNATGLIQIPFDGFVRRIVCGRIALSDAECVELHNNMTAA